MRPESDDNLRLEIGHVLFIDIVGYSRLLIEEQKERLNQLTAIVLATAPVREATDEQLVRLPTGDGMALVFHHSAEEPARCALEIAEALQKHPELPVRMGIHSGPVSEVRDVSGRNNIAGAGINMAQRVMDCGDAGHILLSQHVADDLAHYRKWAPRLHDLGDCEVKHGVRLHLVNLYAEPLGNPAVPEKLRHAKDKQSAAELEIEAAKRDGATRAAATRRRSVIMAAFLFALALAAVMAWHNGWFRSFAAGKSAAPSKIESLAVKPLDNFSGDASKNYFADGMTEELTTKLSQIGALKTVISRSSMMKYKGSSKSASDIAKEVNVGAIVDGSVKLSGDEAVITVELIDGATEKVLWRNEYPRQVANIVQLQNEVALAIANAISLKLTPHEKARLSGGRVVNPEAYKFYLQGKSLGKVDDLKSVDAAIALLEKAVSLDDKFAEAYAALSIAYHNKAYLFAAGDEQLDRKAETAVNKAIELDPNLPEAREARAELIWRPSTGFPHEEAIAEFRRALAVAPNFGDAHFFLGVVYFHVGLIDEASQEFIKTVQLLPDSPEGRAHLGLIALFHGRYSEAVTALEANLPGIPRSFGEYNIACALLYMGKPNEAKTRIDNIKEKIDDEGGLITATQALLLAVAGDKKGAHEKIEEAIKAGQGFGHFHHTTYAVASAYAIMNEPAAAMKWLNYTADNGYPNLTWFERDPNLNSLRKNPEFVSFLARLRPRFEHLKAIADRP